MRPRDVIFAAAVELPEWVYSLRRQLGSGGSQAPPETLGPVAALDEVRAVCDAVFTGPGPPQSKADRESLKRDVDHALGALGPSVQHEVAASLELFTGDLSRAGQLLDSADGSSLLRGAASALEQQITRPEVARAAWADVCAAYEGNADAEECELRILQLRELCERRGQEWRQMRTRLEGIINDDRAYIPGVNVDGIDVTDWEERSAGLSLQERLALGADAVAADAPMGEVTIWLAFQHAWLDQGHLPVGPVQFFAHWIWPDPVRDGNYPSPPPDPELPELQDSDWERNFEGLPEENFVLARVRLGAGHLAGARDRARDLVIDVVNSALRDTEWVLMDGAASYLEGSGWGYGRFSEPREVSDHSGSARYGPTSSALEKLPPVFVEALVEGDAGAVDAADYVRWDSAVQRIPDAAQRIGLSVRLIERALTGSDDKAAGRWPSAARRFLRGYWSERRLGLWLRDLTFAVLSVHPGRRETPPGEQRKRYQELDNELKPSTGEMSFDFYGDRALKRLPEIVSENPTGSMERRLLDELIRRTSTGPDAAAWLDYFDERFERLLARTVRQRNAILHGTTTVPAVLDSVEPFVQQLTDSVVAEKVHAAARRTSATEAMESFRYASTARRARLRKGTPAHELLFTSG